MISKLCKFALLFIPACLAAQPSVPFVGFTSGERDPGFCTPGSTPLHYNTMQSKLKRCVAQDTWMGVVDETRANQPGGYPVLGSDGKVPAAQLPAAQLPVCSGGVTTNCLPSTDAAGSLAIGTTVLDATAGFLARVTVWTSGACTPVSTGFTYNNSAGAMGCTLPAITSANVGLQLCFENDSTRTGAITLTMPASTTVSIDGTAGSSAGTLVSGGAAGDRACVVAKAAGKYMGYVGSGSWANN
jgi:hypothetical protein